MGTLSFALLWLLAQQALCFVAQQSHPTPTALDELNAQGWTPKPTEAPAWNHLGLMPERELFGRAAGSATACAYWSGNAAHPVYCFNGGNCAWWTSEHYLACCSTDTAGSFITSANCAPATGCVPYSVNWLSASITHVVTTLNNVLCPAMYPECYTGYVTVSHSATTYSFYSCYTSSATYDFLDSITTSSGNLTTFTIQAAISISTISTTTTSSTIITSSTTTTSSTITTSSTTTNPILKPVTPIPTPVPPPPPHPNSGPIAGRVVGGLAGIALIGGVIWFMVRRKRTQREEAGMPEISYHPRS
ncbi:hypothetical protein LTR66_000948 [Elasticomyces elasticus]|nr:hypothetical protein LTR66_000948 [Elasticomyces elasticus]